MSKIADLPVFMLAAVLAANPGPACSAQSPDPALAPPDFVLAIQDLISQGKLSEARARLDTATPRYRTDGGLANLRGIINAQEDHYPEAEREFQNAVRLSPGLEAAYLNLARLYESKFDSDPAAVNKTIENLRALLRRFPSHQEARYNLSRLLEWNGSFAASLAELHYLNPAEQAKARAQAIRCADLSGLGHTEEALLETERLLTSPDLRETDVQAILPVVRRKKQNPLERRLLEGLNERRLASAELRRNLATLYLQENELTRARAILDELIGGQDHSVEILLDAAWVAYSQKDLPGALVYLAQARDLDSGNSKVHFFFGVVTLEMNLPIDAKRSLQRAIELEPNNAYAHYSMGLVALQGHDASEALPYFRSYIRLKPADPRGRMALGTALYYAGRYEDAKQELSELIRYPETAAGAHYFLGRIAKIVGDLNQAAKELEASVTGNPDYPDAHAELGLVYIRMSNYKNAEQELQRALQLDADNFLGNTNLLVLYKRTHDARAEEQSERVKHLQSEREKRQDLLMRTVEFRPL